MSTEPTQEQKIRARAVVQIDGQDGDLVGHVARALAAEAEKGLTREARRMLDFARGYGEAALDETTTSAAKHYLRERLCDAAKEYAAAIAPSSAKQSHSEAP